MLESHTNAQLRAALEQLRAEFLSLRRSDSSPPPAPAPKELPAEAPTPARSARKRALTALVEGERDLKEFKSEIGNSMKEVRESVQSLQGTVMTLIEAVAALTGRVNTRVGLGESIPVSSGGVINGLLSEVGGALDVIHHMKGQAKAPDMAGQDNEFLIWEWNCAWFLPKKAVLQQFVRSRKC